MSGSASPMMLALRPKRGKGVRRLNHRPIYIGAVAFGLVIVVVGYTYHERMNRQQEQAAKADSGETKGSASFVKNYFSKPSASASRHTMTATAASSRPMGLSQPMPAQQTDALTDARKKAWAKYYADLDALQQSKAEAATKALTADTTLADSGQGGTLGGQSSLSQSSLGGRGGAATGTTGSEASKVPNAGVDANAQAEKRSFLAQGGDPLGVHEDLLAGLHGPKFDAIMEGTAIPGVMIGGLTTDMPGMVVGMIDANIYDTATGDKLLIPQGSRVVGQYDNSVSGGQERVGVIWNRIIFPDTSSLQIGSMEGADQGGYAGFHDLVDTHFWDKFLAATMISIAGAAAQLAQPQQSALSGYSPTSVGAGAMTQGYSQLGNEYARAGLSIPNTIDIRPGYRFTIMVAKDIHLPIYVDKRNANTHSVASTGPIFQ